MGRSLLVFFVFATATIAIILLQPGPREDMTTASFDSAGTTRNSASLLIDQPLSDHLPVSDQVLGALKANRGARAGADEMDDALPPATALGSREIAEDVPDLLKTPDDLPLAQPVATPVAAAPVAAASARPPAPLPAAALRQAPAPQPVSRDLRSMSWQSLSSLQKLRHQDIAAGQEGSLVNSIVRRSMAHVGSAPHPAAPQPIFVAPEAQVQIPTPPISPAPHRVQTVAAMQEYEVVPGDYLALIAVKLYGSALAKERILDANPELRANPSKLRIGQKLRYPVQ